MKEKVYILIFDGLADWEPSFALTEINKSGKYDVVSVGFSKEIVTTMGGLKLVPDIQLDELSLSNAALFILPGGQMWEQFTDEQFLALLRQVHDAHVPIGAICGATVQIARAGLTNEIYHTSNAVEFMQYVVPEYRDAEYYVNELATSDQNIITASGFGNIEFAREIFKQLQLFSEEGIENWYQMFKNGIYSPVIA